MTRWFGGVFSVLVLLAVQPIAAREPIIDIHLHAPAADDQGPPPLAICTPMDPMPLWDQTASWTEAMIAYFKPPPCSDPIWSPLTEAQIKTKSLAIIRRLNLIGVVNDSKARVRDWRADYSKHQGM